MPWRGRTVNEPSLKCVVYLRIWICVPDRQSAPRIWLEWGGEWAQTLDLALQQALRRPIYCFVPASHREGREKAETPAFLLHF